MGTKKYIDENVYTSACGRIDYIFNNFEKIYISFSGGKDSAVLLNLVVDYMRKHKVNKKVGIFFVDLEGQYQLTIEYIKATLRKHADLFEVYWCCLPLNLRNAVSVFEPFWTPWDMSQRENWIREYPDHPCIKENNHPFPFFRKHMEFEDFVPSFGRWYAGGRKTACLVGIRSDESYNRFRTIVHKKKEMLNNLSWTTKVPGKEKLYNCYPIYDWRIEDVWVANDKFDWEYNKLYDLMYKAGVPLSNQRICQPYGDDQRVGLNLFRVIEPHTWAKVVNRVSGANFGNIYSGNSILGYRKVKLPKGHSWRSYTKLMLATLPKELAKSYRDKFVKFIRYWHRTGSVVPKEYHKIFPIGVLAQGGISNRGRKGLPLVTFRRILDSIPTRLEVKKIAPTWRRMAVCILKNDHMCRSLSFSQTKKQRERMRVLLEKYSRL